MMSVLRRATQRRPLRFGVIGCGTIAEHRHIPTLMQLPEAELVAIADIRPDQLERLGRRFGIPHRYTDYHELLARDDIDVVTVATPVDVHAPVVFAAARAGKHVFCEKPPASDTLTARRMVEAMAEADRLLVFNLEARYRSDSQLIRRWLTEGRIGRPRFWRFIHNWRGGRWAGLDRYQRLISQGMGPIVDCGIHDFDLLLWLSRTSVVSLEADGLWVENYENPDHVVAKCRLADGGLAVIDHSWVYGHRSQETLMRRSIEIEGEHGLIVSEGRTCTLYAADGTIQEEVEDERPFAAIYRALIERIEKVYGPAGEKTREDGSSGSRTTVAGDSEAAPSTSPFCDLPVGEDGVRALDLALQALESAFLRMHLPGEALRRPVAVYGDVVAR